MFEQSVVLSTFIVKLSESFRDDQVIKTGVISKRTNETGHVDAPTSTQTIQNAIVSAISRYNAL